MVKQIMINHNIKKTYLLIKNHTSYDFLFTLLYIIYIKIYRYIYTSYKYIDRK